MTLSSFLGWVVSLDGKAHCLYLNENKVPVYWCGDVLYSPGVSEQPELPGMDVVFCANCIRIAKR